MSTLDLAQKDFKVSASLLGDYNAISINDLADGYCAATDIGDEELRNQYFSALLLRFWYKIPKLCMENQSLGIDQTDVFSWVTGAIIMACDKDARAWQTNPKLNAQQVINQVLATRFVAAAYYDSNLLKNQGRHLECSLDDPLGDEEGSTLGDIIADDKSATPGDDGVWAIIQDYLNKNKVIEAIILDNVAFKDVFKHEKKIVKSVDHEGNPTKHTEYYTAFWPFKLVKELGALDEQYVTYFLNTYSVSRKAFETAFAVLAKANNQKKYKMVDATMTDLRLARATI
jgi:hypothetical protein